MGCCNVRPRARTYSHMTSETNAGVRRLGRLFPSVSVQPSGSTDPCKVPTASWLLPIFLSPPQTLSVLLALPDSFLFLVLAAIQQHWCLVVAKPCAS